MKYIHTNIAAEDWRKLADFYIRVFGCKEKPPQRKFSGVWLDRGTGLSGAKLEGVHLLLPGYGETAPTLEIFSYQDSCGRDPVMANHIGFTHIAFEVEDVNRTFTAALEHGATKLGDITAKTIDGIGKLIFVYFRDPEGNIVEIQSWEE